MGERVRVRGRPPPRQPRHLAAAQILGSITMTRLLMDQARVLEAAGLSGAEVERWRAARPDYSALAAPSRETWERDRAAASEYWTLGEALLERLPPKPRRAEREQAAAETLQEALRDARTRFLRAYAEPVYAE